MTTDLDIKRQIEYARKEGLEMGLQQGRGEGVEHGFEKGLKKGREEGMERGIEKGAEQAHLNDARSLKSLGVSTDIIVKATGLPSEIVEGL